jgi:hypothetical protein
LEKRRQSAPKAAPLRLPNRPPFDPKAPPKRPRFDGASGWMSLGCQRATADGSVRLRGVGFHKKIWCVYGFVARLEGGVDFFVLVILGDWQ